MFNNIFENKTIIITGHTGFKGSWLSVWLTSLGANVIGVSHDVPTHPSHYGSFDRQFLVDDVRVDVRNVEEIGALVQKHQPDFIFHLAAQALVRPSYENPLETITTNSIGSTSVLESLRELNKTVVAVMITSDKAYDNMEWVWGYRETDRLGGKDPYSASKGMAELAIRCYVESFFNLPDSNVKVGITRAGNVIGGGDWAKDRIVPDCMRAWSENRVVDIRSPNATRPWQHVLEPLSGYLVLAMELAMSPEVHGNAYNFGPPANQNHRVRELIDEMSIHWENVRWNNISQKDDHVYEAGLLKLNCDKALFDLHWQPTLNFEETVRMTVEWYKDYYQRSEISVYDYTMRQIEEYTELAFSRDMIWARK